MASNQGNPIAHRGLPACGRCYVAGDHQQKDCRACVNCRRHGHQQNTCPYKVGTANCDHCHRTDHLAGNCPELQPQNKQALKCQVKDCKIAAPTWLHPHTTDEKNTLTAIQRATICGTDHAEKSIATRRPKLTTIHKNGESGARAAPSCITAIYRHNTDKILPPGHTGQSIVTNYVKLPDRPQVVYEYRIDIVPPPTPDRPNPQMTQRSERKRVFDGLRRLPVLSGHADYFTDYDTLWSCRRLDQAHLANTSVQYSKQSGQTATVPSVTLFFIRSLNFSNGSSDLVGQATDEHNPNLLIKALNGMVTKCITERQKTDLFEASANSFYLKNGSIGLGKALLVNRGYFTSVRPGQKDALLNVNIMHGTFLRPTVVSTFLTDMKLQYGEAEKILKGRTVRVMYERGRNNNIDHDLEDNRKKQIAGFGKVPRLQQFDDGKRMWTVKEWFEAQGLTISDLTKPCVNVGLAAGARPGGRGALWIPAEFLEIEPHQAFGKMLNPADMRDMLDIALKSPAANQAAIVKEGLGFWGVDNPETQTDLKETYHFKIGHQLLQIPAQFLKAPVIQYRTTSKSSRNASWDIASDQFIRTPQAFQNSLPLGVLDLRKKGGASADEVGLELLKRCKWHGMLKNDPVPENIQVMNPKKKQFGQPPQNEKPKQFYPEKWYDFLGEISSVWENAGNPEFVLVLIDQNEQDLYAAIKLVGDGYAGFKSIVCTNKKVSQGPHLKDDKQLMSNLALKFNIKCGGQNHAVNSSASQSAFSPLHTASASPARGMTFPGQSQKSVKTDPNSTDTMVIGVDVVHPGGDTPSIAAMVGTVDSHFANFPGSIRLQPGRVEVLTGSNMQELFAERLAAFRKVNGKDPKRLLYYRDGVSEDQYYQVLSDEVNAIQKVLPEIAITAIVVGKRHHTRFFCADDEASYKEKGKTNGNAKPGLLVDKIITQPKTKDGFSDFFLQSHAAIRGTAKSAHYVVIRNDAKCKLTMPAIYDLTHAFCYDYARATKGVSYCAPAYYADRLCDRMHRFLKLYMRANNIGDWTMNEDEQAMQNKAAAGLAFRTRIASQVHQHDYWKLPDSPNPWHPAMNDIMFWL